MAHVTEAPVRAFAHCPDPRCPGNAQEEIDGVVRHTDVLYTDTDPNGIPGVEKSYESVAFADESEAPCPHCETFREITQQKRPVYENRSRQDPNELLRRQDIADSAKDEEVARLNAVIDQLSAAQAAPAAPAVDVQAMIEQMRAEHAEQIATLRAELDAKANKPGPKPKAE